MYTYTLEYKHVASYLTVIIAGNIDNSGMRLTLTRMARQYNSSVSGVGAEVNTNLFVPPNTDNFDIYGYCNSDCTRQVYKIMCMCVSVLHMYECIYMQSLLTQHVSHKELLELIN